MTALLELLQLLILGLNDQVGLLDGIVAQLELALKLAQLRIHPLYN